MVNRTKQDYQGIGKYFSKMERSLWPEMKKYLKQVKKNDSILDVGCGEGRLIQGIKTPRYTGTDFSPTLLEIAKKRYPKRKFLLRDITTEKGWKGLKEYDKVFCVAVIHHLATKKEQLFVMKQIKKHLKTNGTAYISVWDLWQKKFWKEHLKSIIQKTKNWRVVEIPFRQGEEKRLYVALGKKRLKELTKKAGLKIKKIQKTKKNIWLVVEKINV